MRRVATVLVALLLVSSATATPAAAQLSTPISQEECSELDQFINRWVNSASYGLSTGIEGCLAPDNGAIDQMKQEDGNQTKVDIYSAASATKAGQDSFFASYSNYLNDSEATAWMKAQSAVAQAYENGSTKAEAKIQAREAISSYYAIKQENLIERWNITVSHARYLDEQATMEDGISSSFVAMDATGSNLAGEDHELWYENRSMGLVDGSSHGVLAVVSTDMYSGSGHPYKFTPATGQQSYQSYQEYHGLEVSAPNSNYDNLQLLTFDEYATRWSELQSMNSNLQSEIENFVDATWTDFEAGNINSTDVLSANTAMFEYGVRSGAENESLWSSTAALSMMGYDTPTLNNSGTMRITYGAYDFHGLVMARNAPNGTWTNGTTYNTSNIDGPVFFLTTDGEKIDTTDGETFTIESISAKDGTPTETVNTTQYVYKSANTTQFLEMQSELESLRQEIENREASIGGGSGLGSSKTMIAIVALAGAALLLGRSNH